MATFGGLKTMWLVVVFDLPTNTTQDRKRYRNFRNVLLDDGFIMLQYSVYTRHCGRLINSEVHRKRIHKALPQNGEVRVLALTDKQFGHIEVFYGKLPRAIEQAPEQVMLF